MSYGPTAPLPRDAHAAAIEVLCRIYTQDAGQVLSTDDQVLDWIDDEIAAFIREFGYI